MGFGFGKEWMLFFFLRIRDNFVEKVFFCIYRNIVRIVLFEVLEFCIIGLILVMLGIGIGRILFCFSLFRK